MEKEWLFDRPWTRDFTKLRQAFIAELLEKLRQKVGLVSAIDVGCGIGDFSKFLSDAGLRVVGVDGREENTGEARRRYPDITFVTEDAEELRAAQVGAFDLVLCFGLLYHLENPFRAIRNLQALTEKVLLIETMCVPGSEPTMELLDESMYGDQGLRYVAFYPSEACIVKMLYRAGFPFVYRFQELPAAEFYVSTVWRERLRTFIAASRMPLDVPGLIHAKEPIRLVFEFKPWNTRLATLRDTWKSNLLKLRIFVARIVKPARDKSDSDRGDN